MPWFYFYCIFTFSVENVQKLTRKCKRIKTTHHPIIEKKLLIFWLISSFHVPSPKACLTVLPNPTSKKPSLTDEYFFERDKNLKYKIVPAVIFIMTHLGILGIKK